MDAQTVLEWLSQNHVALIIAIGIVAFLESFALLGVLIPGVVILVALSTAVGSSGLGSSGMLIAGFFGAFLGDGLSFYIGYRFKQSLYSRYPFSQYPQLIHQGQKFFREYGLIGIVAGRFIGPLRPIVPLIAGSLSMRPAYYLLVNFLSAIAWSALYLLPGYWLGKSVSTAHFGTQNFLLIVVMFLLCVTTTAWLSIWLHSNYQKSLKHHGNHTTVMTSLPIVLQITSIAVFIILQGTVHPSSEIRINQYVLSSFLTIQQDTVRSVFIFLTGFGNVNTIAFFTAILAAWLAAKEYWASSIAFVATSVISLPIVFGLKVLFNEARPNWVLQTPTSAAFPSGHTVSVLFCLGFVGVLAMQSSRRRHHFKIIMTLTTFGLSICLSRLYLGVHWLTDILGGICVATILLISCFQLRDKLTHSSWGVSESHHRLRANQLLAITGVTLAMTYLLITLPNFSQMKKTYALQNTKPYDAP